MTNLPKRSLTLDWVDLTAAPTSLTADTTYVIQVTGGGLCYFAQASAEPTDTLGLLNIPQGWGIKFTVMAGEGVWIRSSSNSQITIATVTS